jgi:hypothetical protein
MFELRTYFQMNTFQTNNCVHAVLYISIFIYDAKVHISLDISLDNDMILLPSHKKTRNEENEVLNVKVPSPTILMFNRKQEI